MTLPKSQIGTRYKWRNFEFWAHCGKVALLDTDNIDPNLPEIDSVKFLSPRDFLARACGVYAIIADTHRKEGKKLLEQALECVKEAKNQGDISDPKVYQDKAERYGKPMQLWIPEHIRQESFMDKLRRLRKISGVDYKVIMKEGYERYLERNDENTEAV
jgi:hypothetical protein